MRQHWLQKRSRTHRTCRPVCASGQAFGLRSTDFPGEHLVLEDNLAPLKSSSLRAMTVLKLLGSVKEVKAENHALVEISFDIEYCPSRISDSARHDLDVYRQKVI
jgi:hypothetical protein